MWGALLTATMAAWLHQLTGRIIGQDIVAGHGVRGGARPGTACPPRSWPGSANCPSPALNRAS